MAEFLVHHPATFLIKWNAESFDVSHLVVFSSDKLFTRRLVCLPSCSRSWFLTCCVCVVIRVFTPAWGWVCWYVCHCWCCCRSNILWDDLCDCLPCSWMRWQVECATIRMFCCLPATSPSLSDQRVWQASSGPSLRHQDFIDEIKAQGGVSEQIEATWIPSSRNNVCIWQRRGDYTWIYWHLRDRIGRNMSLLLQFINSWFIYY